MTEADDASIQLIAEAYQKHELWTLHVMGLAHLYASIQQAMQHEGQSREAEKMKIIGDAANALRHALDSSRPAVTKFMESKRHALPHGSDRPH